MIIDLALTYFIDDSGRNDPPVFVLGGLALETTRIRAFSQDWEAALAAQRPIPAFKMKEANRRAGVFDGFSVAERDAKIVALADVIRTHAISSISVVVRHKDYERVFKGRMMRSLDGPYQLFFHLVIATAYNLRRQRGTQERASFVFDRQVGEERALYESLAEMRANLHPDISDFLADAPRHADDRDEVALQAADMIAWHVRRSWRDGNKGLQRASAAGPLLAEVSGRHEFLDMAAVERLASIATGTIRRMRTVFPYEAAQINASFEHLGTLANLELMARAQPFVPIKLISFPAIGTSRFRLVRRCDRLDRPHLHRKAGNACQGAATAQ